MTTPSSPEIDLARFPGDPLSARARQALRINAQAAYAELVPTSPPPPDAAELLHAMTPADVIDNPLASADDAACVLAALWLWHDALDLAHPIAQVIDTPAGSLLHAIIHRREGDFTNAKYWYARSRQHPSLPAIGIQANDVLRNAPADKSLLRLNLNNTWNGPAFVDLVEQVHTTPADPRHAMAIALQQLEWRVLFDHCLRAAGGA